ncbi:MAG: efflux RND transporter periplasmic adaptor subunit, partial [Bacteroidales bacterium]|nr:efflux RND transporter periplasmic adaptor subunit [Bacteroidales bacterium]
MKHKLLEVIRKRSLLAVLLLPITMSVSGQPSGNEQSLAGPNLLDSAVVFQNELTIYVIPSTVKYDWSSPRTLYKSYARNYIRNIFKKKHYQLGHAFIELTTPLAPGRIFTGMRSASIEEPVDMVRKENYGLAVLGADMAGALETETHLTCILDRFSSRGQLAFMRFLISDEATERMLQFFQAYKGGNDGKGSHAAHYGGAFWPRFEGEGSGCSAFAVSFLDLAGILKDEFDMWKVRINIPLDLIGGPYNDFNPVRIRDIKKRYNWADPATDQDGFEYLEMYDPARLVIVSSVPETRATKLHERAAVEVHFDGYPQRTFKGSVSRMYPRLDGKTRTRTFEVLVHAPIDLIPGMFARLNVEIARADSAIVVAENAVVTTPKGKTVVYVVENNTAVARPVVTGIRHRDKIQITDGQGLKDSSHDKMTDNEILIIEKLYKYKEEMDNNPDGMTEAPEKYFTDEEMALLQKIA